MHVTLRFDGGCLGNPGAKYGSYDIQGLNLLLRRDRFPLGHGTNNEAEFESLLVALDHLLSHPFHIPPREMDLLVQTDSRIVINRLNGRCWHNSTEPAQRMYRLTAECMKLLVQFKSWQVAWVGREENVALFGH